MLEIKVLIIEDIKMVRKSIINMLGEDYIVDEAPDVETAKLLLSSKKYDIILADLNVGDKKGVETIEAICDKAKKTPIIVCSGCIDKDVAIGLTCKGIKEIIAKPLDQNRLRYTIQKVLWKNKFTFV